MLTNETGLRTTSEHTSGMTRFKNFYIPSKYNLFMSQKRLVPLLLILLTMAIFGCTQQVPEQSQQAQQPQPLEQPQGEQPPPAAGEKCPDQVCDDFEKANPDACPADCNGVESKTAPPSEQPTQPQASAERTTTVKALQTKYKTITAKPSGWFKTGQDADIMLSGAGFNNAGGPLQFNHPGGLSTDGHHFILADRFNNRILIWNNLPSDNTAPDIVLGQKDFTSNNPGENLDTLNWPVAVATDGKHIIVADTYNDRLLIWNNFPTTNGQPADIEIKNAGRGQDVDPKRTMGWPWAVWTDGEKLIATATGSAKVLIWDTFPTKNNQPADISISLPESFGTPRTIGSDGKHLVVGDHNVKVKGKEGPGNFFWKSFPNRDNQPYDFLISSAEEALQAPIGQKITRRGDIFWGPTFTADGKLIVLGERLYIWNSFPENENDLPDLSVGSLNRGMSAYKFVGGDGSGIAITGDKIYISLYNGNKIVGYNSIPLSSEQQPDFVVGSPDLDTNSLDNVGFITNPVIETDGKSLFVSSDFDGKLSIWKNLPDEDSAKPDFIYELGMDPWDSELFQNKLILAGRNKVIIWNSLPVNGEAPDIKIEGNIGSVTLNEIRGVALDEKYFYLADGNKIHLWEGIPEKNTDPKLSIDALGATRLSSDGKYLVVAATEAPSEEMIKVYKLEGLSSGSKPILIRNKSFWFNLPQAVLASGGHLFIGDTGNNRVLVWNSIDKAVAGENPNIILGEESIDDFIPEIGRDKLFLPAGMAFDGSYLWVGEFKFSGRIVRFSVGK